MASSEQQTLFAFDCGATNWRLYRSQYDRVGNRVMLVGDAPYYGRFGFRRLDGVVMPPPTNPDRVLGRDLGAWRA